MSTKHLAFALVAAAVISGGCDRTATLVGPTNQTIITEIFDGIVGPPVNDVLQRTFRTYTVGQGGGPVTITLTSAVLTRPDGSTNAAVLMGLGAGTIVNGVCSVAVTSFVTTAAGSTPQLAGNLGEGTYCVQVSDVTSQVGAVAFSVKITHT
jgi:hypothetical protein